MMKSLILPFAVVVCATCGPITEDAVDGGAPGDAGNPFAVEVVAVTYGEGAGYGQTRFPDVVLGAPLGGGQSRGSLDVLSLGQGGTITLRFGADALDGPGADFLVFENAFRTNDGTVWAEPGEVSVSEDGVTFVTFPCDAATPPFEGCAGVTPVLAPGSDGGVAATDAVRSGGDAFDLADVGLSRARFVRITDRSTGTPSPETAGFDLDAVAIVLTRQ